MNAVKLKLFFFLTRFCERTHCLFLDTKGGDYCLFSDPFFLTIQASLKKHSHSEVGWVCKAINENVINDIFSQILC